MSDSKVGTTKSFELVDFSFGGFSSDDCRRELERKYLPLVDETTDFNRGMVSFQANKKASVYNWLKYREGFSSALVEALLDEFKVEPGGVVLDPFMGSGTTALACMLRGLNSLGFDILPISELATKAKLAVFEYDLDELRMAVAKIRTLEVSAPDGARLNALNITRGAYSEEAERELMFLESAIDSMELAEASTNLLRLTLLNILETISYTRKDGQYLRWDYRSEKVVQANARRVAQGKEPYLTILDKGEIPPVRDTYCAAVEAIVDDLALVQATVELPESRTGHNFIAGSTLHELPLLGTDTVDAVITSPPYCNRYDYTRTYALELAFLGVDEQHIRELRQALLTCTVENRPKGEQLREYYGSIGRSGDYETVMAVVGSDPVLAEVLDALQLRRKAGEINNSGVINMVRGYFTELAFTFFELNRACKPGAMVAFVNDNVRYAGEVIPVDFLTSQLAEAFGFRVRKIYTLQQRKGNSSQQMKKYGRVALRKSITIWENC